MTVNLSPRLEDLIQTKVKSGKYNTASEVVREALLLLQERDQYRKVQARNVSKKIDAAWESLERGEGVDGLAFFQSLEREERTLGRKRKRA